MDQKEIAIEIEKLSQIVANRKEKQRIMDILFNVTDDDDNDLKHKYEVNERILSVFEASLNNLKSQLPAQARRSSSRTASTNPALNTERVITRNTYAVFKRTLNYLAGLKLQKAKIEWEYMNGRKSLIRARRERRMFDVISWRVRMQLRELIQLYPDLPELYRIEVHDPVVSVSHASNKSMPPTQRRPSTTHLFNRWFFRNQLRPRVNRINFGQRLPRMQSRRFSGGGPLSGTVMEGEVSRVPFGSIVPPMRSGPGRVGRPLLL